MKIFRYYYNKTKTFRKAGFLTRVGDIIEFHENHRDILEALTKYFDDELPFPDDRLFDLSRNGIRMTSWFTSVGNEKFKLHISRINKYIKKRFNQNMICNVKDISENNKDILYQDKYQVTLKE